MARGRWRGIALVLLGACRTAGPAPDAGRVISADAAPIAADRGDDLHARLAAMVGDGNFHITRTFTTGFESLDDFFGSYVERSGHLGTTFHQLDGTRVHGGQLAHHAWITAANPVHPPGNTSHRGYPTLQFQRSAAGPFVERVVVELWAWLDVAVTAQPEGDWFSFLTLTSYADDAWPRVVVLNLNPAGHLYLMHVPQQQQSVHDIFQTDSLALPLRQWVRLSVLVDYTAQNRYDSPYVAAWQDGQLVSAARFDPRVDPNSVSRAQWPACLATWDGASIPAAEALCNLDYRGGLVQAHFGMYAAPRIATGTVFNDDLAIYELRR
jgi:hypothetical protein